MEHFGTNLIWGNETNGIRLALLINPEFGSNNVPIRCTPIIKSNQNHTNHLWIWFPPIKNSWQMTLTDEKGNAVPKTAKGNLLGKPIKEPLMLKDGPNFKAGYKMRPLDKDRAEVLSDFSFILQNYFEVTNSGKYHLSYRMRIILPQSIKGDFMMLHTTNLPLTTLPPVKAEVEIKERVTPSP